MGLAGILVSLGLLIWLAYRGWSVLVLAPAAALVAAAFSQEPLLAHWTQTFMGSAAQFVMQFFPIFLLGALFGKLMEDSGSVEAIARFMTEKLGPQRASLAVVLAGALVTYGGVSLFVAFFVLAPMALAMFKAADIPRRLMPAAIFLGSATFTMSALPGSPAIQNAIPMPFFGTTPFAAPGLGIIAAVIMLGFGLWWLARAEAAARKAGEGFGKDAKAPAAVADDELVRERATVAQSFDPAEICPRQPRSKRAAYSTCRPAPPCRHRRQSSDVVLGAAATRCFVSGRGTLGENLAHCRGRSLGCDRCAGCSDRRPHRRQPPAPSILAPEHRRGRKRIRIASLQRCEPRGFRRCRCGSSRLWNGSRLGAFHRRRTAGFARRRNEHPCRPDRLGLGRTYDRARRLGRDLYAHCRPRLASIRRLCIALQ